MIAAIYARKSTEQNGVPEEQRSVTRQIEHATAYAVRKGWSVAVDHVYVDDGISGAEFANRPGFLRLMNALKPKAAFDALVMSEESRLGRESIETAYALKQLISAGVRVFFYLEDRERTLNGPMEKAMLALQTMADEMEREKARQRVYDTMIRKARAGHVTGGRTFGYENVPSMAAGADGRTRRQHVTRQIIPSEAAIVRQIFELYAIGVGQRAIAKTLNDEGAITPRPQQKRPAGWTPSAVRGILLRDLYRGRIVWNKTQKRNTWGQIRVRDRAAAEWITIEAPDLRIISDELWRAAQSRFTTRRALYVPDAVNGAAARQIGGYVKYLLPKLATCGVCGCGMAVRSRKHGKGRQYRYGCHCNWTRGRRACANTLEALMVDADAAVLGVLESDLLRPTVVEEALDRALTELDASDDHGARARAVDRAIEACDRGVAHLVAAITAGGDLSSLLPALRVQEARRAELADARRQVEPAPRIDRTQIQRVLRVKLADWRARLTTDRVGARRLLETVLDGRIVFTPEKNEYGFEAYRVRIALKLDRVFEAVLPFRLASPNGSGSAWTLVRELFVRAA